MTIKFLRSAANQYLSAPDSAAQTFPPGDWALSWVTVFDGITTGDTPQYFFSNAPFSATGSLNIAYQTAGAGNGANHIQVYADTAGTGPTSTTAIAVGMATLFVLQHSDGNLILRSCLVKNTAPADATGVVTELTVANASTFDGAGLFIGSRSDLAAARFCDQSLARFFRYDGRLTDLEVAKLAYGMEITDLGKTPAWYIKMDTPSDIADRGTQGNTFVAHGSLATGTAPGFGYVPPAATAPVITGAPAIVGTPQVGSASGYTQASVSGSPTPTRTLQWKLDGAAISGATGTSYTPVSGDAGHTLTVTQTETNATNSASATSSGVIVATASSTVDVTQLSAERIYQRNGTSATVALTGSYTATVPTSIEYQLYAEDGTTILAAWAAISGVTISSGAWSGAPSMQQGGMYRIAVRSKNGAAVLATSNVKANLFGIGDIIADGGSSTIEKSYQNYSGTGFTAAANVRRNQGGVWSKFTTDGCAILIANSLAAQSGVPVGMLGYGVGGDTLATWINTSSASWIAFANAISACGKIAGARFAVGSNDAANNAVASRSQHLANMRTLIANTRALTGQPNLPCVWSGFNRRRSDQVTTTQADFVRMAEDDIEADAFVCHVQLLDLELTDDLVHLSPNTNGFPASALRTAYQGGQLFYNGAKVHGPKITAFNYTSSAITATVAHRNGSALTPGSAINGFAASDSSGALTFASVVATSATQIVMTPTRAIVGAPIVTYLSGSSPVSATTAVPTNEVFDNGATPLPMTVETDLAATLAASLATTVTFNVKADAAGTAVPDTTDLDYAFYDSPRISTGQAPIKYGSTLAITGGSVTIDITGLTALAPGGTGRIVYGPADGSKIAGGQVTVS